LRDQSGIASALAVDKTAASPIFFAMQNKSTLFGESEFRLLWCAQIFYAASPPSLDLSLHCFTNISVYIFG